MTTPAQAKGRSAAARRDAEDAAIVRALRAGEVDAVVVAGQVVTLAEVAQPYRTFVEIMSDGAATLATDGLVLWANARLATTLGVSVERIVGRSFYEFIPDQGRAALETLVRAQAIAGSPESLRVEASVRSEEGQRLPVVLSLAPVSGKAAVAVVVSSRPAPEFQPAPRSADPAPHAPSIEVLCERAQLTAREQDVVVLIAQGLSNKAVADRLRIASNTVACYLTRVYKKLRVSGRNELMARVLSRRRA